MCYFRLSMRNLILESVFRIYEQDSELSATDRRLVEAAHQATQQAYAPYSQFFVGAVIEFEDGTTFSGSNQENAAYPSGICAERTALFAAGHLYPTKKVKSMAIAAHSQSHPHESPVPPCGACLQVISETERRQKMPVRLLLCGNNGEVMECESVKALMPLMFDLD